MKIIFVTNNYTPYSGGIVSSIESFSNELKHQGHQVIIITLDFTGIKTPEDSIIRLYCPIKFSYRNNPMAIPLFTKKQLRKLFLALKPDIVHVHHPFLLGQAARTIAKELGIPTVFTHHSQYDQYALHYVPIFPKLISKIINNRVIKFCQGVDHLIAPTLSINKELQSKGVTTKQSIVPSGVLPLFESLVYTIKHKQPLFRLLCVSRFVSEKNIPFLFDVLKDLGQGFTLTLIGFGVLYEELKSYAYKVLKFSSNQVHFIYQPPKMIIAQAYTKADLFIFSSLTETQGIVFAESMMAGTPIVALEAPGAKDCIKNGVNGYLVDSKESMVKAIKAIAHNPILHEQLQKGAWQEGQSYSRNHTTKKLITVYESMLC